MCLTGGEDGAKVYKIPDSIASRFAECDIPWSNSINLFVDNTITLVGCRNSVAAAFVQKVQTCCSSMLL